MPRTFRPLLAVLAFALFASAAVAQEPIRMARTPDVSPDGKLVAFSYLGDIWVVEAIGGTARAGDHRTPPTTSAPSSARTAVGSPSAPTATAATTSSSCPSRAASRAG